MDELCLKHHFRSTNNLLELTKNIELFEFEVIKNEVNLV